MSTIVYQVVNGRKYAYESTSYWDTKKQAPRSKRKYLGRVDPDTGEIITKKSHAKTAKRKMNRRLSVCFGERSRIKTLRSRSCKTISMV